MKWRVARRRKGGPRPDEPLVDFTQPLDFQVNEFDVMAYAVTYIWSESPGDFLLLVNAFNVKGWLNGELVFKLSRYPGFCTSVTLSYPKVAHRYPIRLKSGWNELLVRVESDRRLYAQILSCDGKPLPALITSANPNAASSTNGPPSGSYTWYRLSVPPGCVGFSGGGMVGEALMWLDGEPLLLSTAREAEFGPLDPRRHHVLAIRLNPGAELLSPAQPRVLPALA